MDRSKQVFLIQRRWREIIKDLAVQRGIDAEILLRRIPAFASGSSFSESGINTGNFSKEELEIFKTAHDTIAEVIISMVREHADSTETGSRQFRTMRLKA